MIFSTTFRALIILTLYLNHKESHDAKTDYYKMINYQTKNGECRTKWMKARIWYYNNSTATFNLILLSGDVETNPGWEDDENEEDYLQEFASSMCKERSALNIAQINIRSLRNKVDEVKILLSICRFDILAITETHLDEKISDKQLENENYKIIRRDRGLGQSGGGCLIYIANHVCTTHLKSLETMDVEGI